LLVTARETPDTEFLKSTLRVLLALKARAAESIFRSALEHDDDEVRAIGAKGLYLIDARDALQAALLTIDDAPNVLHNDLTPSVDTIAEIGMTALSHVLPLLEAENRLTRLHAQRILERVVFDVTARSSEKHLAQSAAEQLWIANGNYRWNADSDVRRASLARWRDWLRNQDTS